MALAINTRTGKSVSVPDHYIGHSVLGKDLVLEGEPVQTAPKIENKKPSKYFAKAVVAEADVPVGLEIMEQSAPDNNIEENEE
jgi:hypothetical protein